MMTAKHVLRKVPTEMMASATVISDTYSSFRVFLFKDKGPVQRAYIDSAMAMLPLEIGGCSDGERIKALLEAYFVLAAFLENRDAEAWQRVCFGHWFVAKEIGPMVGYSNYFSAIERHVNPADVRLYKASNCLGRKQTILLLNLKGVNTLVQACGKRTAVHFEKQLIDCLAREGHVKSTPEGTVMTM
ncbi:MAG: Bro-N domain-containing protein [Eubacterium sp.]